MMRANSAAGRAAPPTSSTGAANTAVGKPQGRAELLDWINGVGAASYPTVPSLKDGIVYCQVVVLLAHSAVAALEPANRNDQASSSSNALDKARAVQLKEWSERKSKANSLLSRLKWSATNDDDCYINMELLREMLREAVPRTMALDIDSMRLATGKLQDHMSLLQWIHGYYTKIHEKYQPTPGRRQLGGEGSEGEVEVESRFKWNPMLMRDAVRKQNPTIILKPELLWSKLSTAVARPGPTAGKPAQVPRKQQQEDSDADPSAAFHYDPQRYVQAVPSTVRPPPGHSSSGSSPTTLPLRYLAPIIDHVEKCEATVERRIVEHQKNKDPVFHHLDRLAVARDDCQQALNTLWTIIQDHAAQSAARDGEYEFSAEAQVWGELENVFRDNRRILE